MLGLGMSASGDHGSSASYLEDPCPHSISTEGSRYCQLLPAYITTTTATTPTMTATATTTTTIITIIITTTTTATATAITFGTG